MQSRNNGSVSCFGSPFLEYSAIIYLFFRFVKTNFRFICQNAHFFTRIAYKNKKGRKNNEKITRKSESQSRFFRRGVRFTRQRILTETDGVCYNDGFEKRAQNRRELSRVRQGGKPVAHSLPRSRRAYRLLRRPL